MQFFDYILLETDVDYLIIGREHTGDFQDLNILLLAAMCFICFREFETKKGASWPQEGAKLPSTKSRFSALQNNLSAAQITKRIVKITLFFLGSKAPSERTFSQMNFIWTA